MRFFPANIGWVALIGLLLILFGTSHASNVSPASPAEGGSPDDDKSLVVDAGGFHDSCEALAAGHSFIVMAPGVSSFTQPLACEPPLTVEIKGEVLLRSHTVFETTGVHFLVHPQGDLIITAPAIDVTRAENLPAFTVNGHLELKATGYTPDRVNGAAVDDKHGVIVLGKRGRVYSHPGKAVVRYTETSVMVAGIIAPEDRVNTLKHEPADILLDLERRLAAFDQNPLDSDDQASLNIGDTAPPPTPPGTPVLSSPYNDAVVAGATAAAADAASGSTAASPRPVTPPVVADNSSAGTVNNPPAAATAAADQKHSTTTVTATAAAGHINDKNYKFSFENGILRDCDAIPAEASFGGGILIIPRPIDCAGELKFIEFTGDTIVQSRTDIFIQDVVFLVARGVRVVLRAPTVTIGLSERGRTFDVPVVVAEGEVGFDVAGWVPEYADGSLEDQTEFPLIWVEPGGVLFSEQPLHYAADSIIVADASAAGKPQTSDDEIAGPRLPENPYLRQLLAKQHAALNSNHDASTTKEHTDSPQSTSGLRPNPRFYDFITKEGREHFGDTGTARGGSSGSGGSTAGGGSGSSGGSSGSRNSDDEGSGGGDGGGFDPDNFPPRDAYLHPNLMLSVGEELEGMLPSPDGTAAIFLRPIDGSVSFYRKPDEEPNPSPAMSGTLLETNPKEMEKVMRTRRAIFEEEKRKAAGQEPKQRSIAGRVSWWWRRREREVAKANMGRSFLTITQRGNLEGYLDGRRVIRKAGPSWFGLGRRRHDREVWTTREGLEVRLNGQRVWGVELADK